MAAPSRSVKAESRPVAVERGMGVEFLTRAGRGLGPILFLRHMNTLLTEPDRLLRGKPRTQATNQTQ